MDALKPITQYLNNIEAINSGGCGISALSIYRWLEKMEMHKDYSFVFLYDTWISNKILCMENLKRLDEGIKALGVPCHIVLVHKPSGMWIDSNGVNVNDWLDGIFPINHIVDNPQVIVHTLNSPYRNSWCPTFNRKHIRNIENILGISLKDIKINI